MRTTKKKKSERNREGGFEREEESYFERSVTSRSNSKRLLEESSRSGEVKVMTRQINKHTHCLFQTKLHYGSCKKIGETGDWQKVWETQEMRSTDWLRLKKEKEKLWLKKGDKLDKREARSRRRLKKKKYFFLSFFACLCGNNQVCDHLCCVCFCRMFLQKECKEDRRLLCHLLSFSVSKSMPTVMSTTIELPHTVVRVFPSR